MSELLQRRSLSEQVYDVLIHDIVTGQIALGDRLINRELQTRFGVSSTPIRDAINKLYQDGLIRELTNSGAQLIDFDQQYAEELNHFIMMLACEALALASQSDQQAEIVRLSFDLYLMAVGSTRIASLLDYLGVPTVTGGTWEGGTIGGMIANEKYKGDFLFYFRRICLIFYGFSVMNCFRKEILYL